MPSLKFFNRPLSRGLWSSGPPSTRRPGNTGLPTLGKGGPSMKVGGGPSGHVEVSVVSSLTGTGVSPGSCGGAIRFQPTRSSGRMQRSVRANLSVVERALVRSDSGRGRGCSVWSLLCDSSPECLSFLLRSLPLSTQETMGKLSLTPIPSLSLLKFFRMTGRNVGWSDGQRLRPER